MEIFKDLTTPASQEFENFKQSAQKYKQKKAK